MSLSDAIEVVGKILQGYPNGRDVPNSYIGALASVIAQYPRCVTYLAGDTIKGVARETRFLPTVADLVGWCERELVDWNGIVARDDRERAIREQMKARADEAAQAAEARKTRPTLQQMQEKHGPNWGLSVTEKEDLIVKAARDETMKKANARAFEDECRSAGVDPNRVASPSLERLLHGEIRMRRAEHLGREADRLTEEPAR